VKTPTSYAEYLTENGGLANTGGHLGVMVAPSKDVDSCPPAWCFVPKELATPELVQDALDWMNRGGGKRENWPEKE